MSAEAAEWAVATGTGLLALATGYLGWQNRRLVKAAASEAEQAGKEATATREMVDEVRRDRTLNWQPYLVSGRNAGDVSVVAVQNIGRGPALRLVYCEQMPGPIWLLSKRRQAIGAAQPANLQLRGIPNPPPMYLMSDIALMCNDQFGNWLRFDPAKGEPEVCPRDSTDRPAWVAWFEGLLPPA